MAAAGWCTNLEAPVDGWEEDFRHENGNGMDSCPPGPGRRGRSDLGVSNVG